MKKIHLMSKRWPSSFCNMRLRDNSGMNQTFKIDEITCKNCMRELKKKPLGKYFVNLLNERR